MDTAFIVRDKSSFIRRGLLDFQLVVANQYCKHRGSRTTAPKRIIPRQLPTRLITPGEKLSLKKLPQRLTIPALALILVHPISQHIAPYNQIYCTVSLDNL